MTENTEAEPEFYYAQSTAQKGPVRQEHLFELVESGEIDFDTLIWLEGDEDWVPFQSKFPEFAAGRVRCAYSGELRKPEDMLEYGEHWIAPEFKEAFVQKLAEGAGTDEDPEDGFVASLTLASIWHQSWTIWKANLIPISVVTVVVWTPLHFLLEHLSYNVWSEMYGEDEFAALGRYFRMERSLETWFGAIATGGIISLAAYIWRGGHSMSVGETFGEGFRNYLRLLGTRIIWGFAMIIVVLVGVLPVVLIDFLPFQIVWGILASVAALYLFVRTGFVDYFAISERAGGFPAISESWGATKGHFWRIVGYQTAVWTAVSLVGIILALPIFLPPLDNFVVSALLSVLDSVVISFGIVETMVLALHLKAHRLPDPVS